METRSYQELKSLIEEFYRTYSDKQLKVFSCLSEDCYPRLVIPYISEELSFFYVLEIIIPGRKTFQVAKDKYSDKKQKNDIKIILRTDEIRRVITHEEIIRHLYNKIAVCDDDSQRCRNYRVYRKLLNYLYSSERLTNEKTNDWIYSSSFDDEETTNEEITNLALVSFIRWCAVQEMINYPYGWGRDLCFARYFEAIYAGFLRDEEILEKVVERANSDTTPTRLHSIEELQNSTAILTEAHIQKNIYYDIPEFERHY